jgi:restriction modification system DNA specificity domain protein
LKATALVPQVETPLIVSTAFAVLRPKEGLLPKYLAYAVQDGTFTHQLSRSAVGVSYPAIDEQTVKAARIPVPDMESQRRIVEFLDAELEQIDALTAEQERLVSLLIERRAAVAEELVSRADSKEVRNRGIFRHVDRKSKTGEEELLSVSHITGVTPRSEKNVTMFEAESKIGYNLVEPGELVINTMWAWMGALGVSDFEGIVSPSYDIYKFIDRGEFCPEYFDMLYRTDRYIGLMKAHSRGIWESRLRLYPDVFLSLTSPVPSLKAQQQIAHEYRVKCAETDELLLKVQSLTSLLEERKQALITAAVTGELEV